MVVIFCNYPEVAPLFRLRFARGKRQVVSSMRLPELVSSGNEEPFDVAIKVPLPFAHGRESREERAN